MDRYGYTAESMTPPREDLLKKIDTTHMHLEDVTSAVDMAAITHNLLSNIVVILRRHGRENDVSPLVDGFVLESIVESLDGGVQDKPSVDDTAFLTVFEGYEAILQTRRNGKGFAQDHLEALRMASHLLLEAHRSIFESDEFVATRAASSVKVLNSLQQACWLTNH